MQCPWRDVSCHGLMRYLLFSESNDHPADFDATYKKYVSPIFSWSALKYYTPSVWTYQHFCRAEIERTACVCIKRDIFLSSFHSQLTMGRCHTRACRTVSARVLRMTSTFVSDSFHARFHFHSPSYHMTTIHIVWRTLHIIQFVSLAPALRL